MPGYAKLSYSERLKKLKLPTLAYRRLRGEMIEMYKICNKLYDPKIGDLVERWEADGQRPSTRGNTKKIFKERAKSELRTNMFKIRVSKIWNSLPEQVVSAPSLNSFKNRFDMLMESQELMYNNYRAEVTIKWDHKQEDIIEESSKEEPMKKGLS